MNADEVVERFALEPHPEGGAYRRVFTSTEEVDGRPVETAILYLLRDGELSRWHRIDATETWSFEDGAPMGLRISGDGVSVAHHLVEEGAPVTVPAHAWQSAVSMGAWSLVRCAVRPGFSFDGFEMAPPSWSPPGG